MSHNLSLLQEIDLAVKELEARAREIRPEKPAITNISTRNREALRFGYIPPYRAAYTLSNASIIGC